MWYRSECIGRKIKMLFDEVKNNELYSESANLVVDYAISDTISISICQSDNIR